MLGLSRTNCEFCRYKSQYSISDCKLLLHENTLSFFVFELTRVQDAFLVALRAIVDWTTQCRIRALGSALWSRNSSRNRITTPTHYSRVPCHTFPRAPSAPGLVEDEIPPSANVAWRATSFVTSSYIKALWTLGVTFWQKRR